MIMTAGVKSSEPYEEMHICFVYLLFMFRQGSRKYLALRGMLEKNVVKQHRNRSRKIPKIKQIRITKPSINMKTTKLALIQDSSNLNI